MRADRIGIAVLLIRGILDGSIRKDRLTMDCITIARQAGFVVDVAALEFIMGRMEKLEAEILAVPKGDRDRPTVDQVKAVVGNYPITAAMLDALAERGGWSDAEAPL